MVGEPDDGVLDIYQAFSFAREWVASHVDKPEKGTASQLGWLMDELSTLCVNEAIRRGEGEFELTGRLETALRIVWNIRWSLSQDSSIETARDGRESRADHSIWERRDPAVAYREGFNSPANTDFVPGDFAHIVAEYLDEPWLRHPFMDWVIIDATVSRELCSFGEELKQRWLPGRRDFTGTHYRYFDCYGKLDEMLAFRWGEAFERWNAWFWTAFAIPVGATWAAFHFNYPTLGGWLLGLYITFVLGVASYSVFRLLRRLFRWATGKPDPRLRPFELWTSMYEVWKRMDGPVINPQRVREAMASSAAKGAVWDAATWAVIDRVCGIDSAVWIPIPRSAGRS